MTNNIFLITFKPKIVPRVGLVDPLPLERVGRGQENSLKPLNDIYKDSHGKVQLI